MILAEEQVPTRATLVSSKFEVPVCGDAQECNALPAQDNAAALIWWDGLAECIFTLTVLISEIIDIDCGGGANQKRKDICEFHVGSLEVG